MRKVQGYKDTLDPRSSSYSHKLGSHIPRGKSPPKIEASGLFQRIDDLPFLQLQIQRNVEQAMDLIKNT